MNRELKQQCTRVQSDSAFAKTDEILQYFHHLLEENNYNREANIVSDALQAIGNAMGEIRSIAMNLEMDVASVDDVPEEDDDD